MRAIIARIRRLAAACGQEPVKSGIAFEASAALRLCLENYRLKTGEKGGIPPPIKRSPAAKAYENMHPPKSLRTDSDR